MKQASLIVLLVTAIASAETTNEVVHPWNPYRQGYEEDQKLPPTEQIDRWLTALRREIASPTETHRGFGGGMITHEYQLHQIQKALFNVLATPAVNGRSIAAPAVVDHLRQAYRTETNNEARVVIGSALKDFDALTE